MAIPLRGSPDPESLGEAEGPDVAVELQLAITSAAPTAASAVSQVRAAGARRDELVSPGSLDMDILFLDGSCRIVGFRGG
jgi:hypothetical protein